jgi:glycerophosphoryl diester phosphodiesterase
VWHRLADQLPLVLGHRGARRHAPENTMAAFELALDGGAAGVELDVRLERTGEVIVLHDRTLTRVTGGRDDRDVEKCRWRELAAVDVGQGETVPRLSAVIAWARARGARVNVELKSDVTHRERLVARTVALLAGQSADHFLLSSFHPGMVRRATELTRAWCSTPIPVALLVHAGSPHRDAAPSWRGLGAVGVHPAAELATPERLVRWRREGALVNVWTVNDPARAGELAHQGVDGIITDDPAAVSRALLRRESP